MKNTFSKMALLAVTGIIAFTSCSVTNHTEITKGISFSNYKTFSWINNNGNGKADRINNDISDNNIKNLVSRGLEKKGWKEVMDNADAMLDYNVVVEKRMTRGSEPLYSYPFTQYFYGRHGRLYSIWYPSNLIGYHSYNMPFKEGTLTINMVDAKTHKMIWQGWSKGDVSSHITNKDVTTRVRSIFRKFDYPQIS